MSTPPKIQRIVPLSVASATKASITPISTLATKVVPVSTQTLVTKVVPASIQPLIPANTVVEQLMADAKIISSTPTKITETQIALTSITQVPSVIIPPASIADLQIALNDLAIKSVQDVSTVRTAFTTGIAPIKVSSSGSTADLISKYSISNQASEIVKSTAQLGLSTATPNSSKKLPKPEIDLIEINNDRTFGALDSFYARVLVSIAADEISNISFIRIMRSSNGSVSAPKPSFSAMVDSTPLVSRTKSADSIANMAFRAADIGVGNKLTTTVKDDKFSKQKIIVSSAPRALPPIVNTNRKETTTAGLVSLSNVDRSVVENVGFYINQRTLTESPEIIIPLKVANQQGINVLQGSSVANNNTFTEVNNSAGFYELTRLSLARNKIIGSFVEIEYFDPSIIYGAGYTYYASAVTNDGVEGPRSRLVNVDVKLLSPPSSPSILYSVVSGKPRFSITCDGKFLDHIEIFRKGGIIPQSVVLLSTEEEQFTRNVPISTATGFYHIGDSGLGSNKSTTFIDSNVKPGQKLEYRFYTVDSFGMKSSTPFSCSIMLPGHGDPIPLPVPSITAEQIQGGAIVNILVSCDDSRITKFVVGRRDVSLNENSFRQPSVADTFTLGISYSSAKRSKSRLGTHFDVNSHQCWNGILDPESGSATFNDSTAKFDRKYQYNVFAVDNRGNKSSCALSNIVFVTVKPISDNPVNVQSLVHSVDNVPSNVIIKWSIGTNDFSPNDLIGDQDVLAATAKRTVFQVERRQYGNYNWDAMPATTESYFIDNISLDEKPKFRPEYAKLNVKYDYRVIAMQSGAFISTHSDITKVSVVPEIVKPQIVWVRSTPTSIRPFHLVVSWQYDGEFIDSWDIERAVTNKIFGAKITSMNSKEASALIYTNIAKITRESSKSQGISSPSLMNDNKIFIGNRFFIDQDIDLANSYFYRVRSVDTADNKSDWTFSGIMLSDSPHDRKFMSTLSDNEKTSLTTDNRPISKWRNK
jgi:hypothetical protein